MKIEFNSLGSIGHHLLIKQDVRFSMETTKVEEQRDIEYIYLIVVSMQSQCCLNGK